MPATMTIHHVPPQAQESSSRRRRRSSSSTAASIRSSDEQHPLVIGDEMDEEMDTEDEEEAIMSDSEIDTNEAPCDSIDVHNAGKSPSKLYTDAVLLHNALGATLYQQCQYHDSLHHFRDALHFLLEEENYRQQLNQQQQHDSNQRTASFSIERDNTMSRIESLQQRYCHLMQTARSSSMGTTSNTSRRSDPYVMDRNGALFIHRPNGNAAPVSAMLSSAVPSATSSPISSDLVASIVLYNQSLVQASIGNYTDSLELLSMANFNLQYFNLQLLNCCVVPTSTTDIISSNITSTTTNTISSSSHHQLELTMAIADRANRIGNAVGITLQVDQRRTHDAQVTDMEWLDSDHHHAPAA